MSESPVAYRVREPNLLQSRDNAATMEQGQAPMPFDLEHFERQLIPLLNWVRRMQGKKPVIVPKG